MKRWMVLALVLALLAGLLPASAAGKQDSLPAVFRVEVLTEERVEGKQEKYLYRETLKTRCAPFNQSLREAADRLEAALFPLLAADPQGKAKNNSRLDIEANYTKTGHSWMSVLLIGRVSYRRVQTELAFEALSYDLKSGARLGLSDLFPADSAGWDFLAGRVRAHLDSVFPGEERDSGKIAAAASLEGLEQAAFTLAGGSLTLHYLARDFGFSQPGMVHVRFYYPELAGMLSPEAARQTDNSHWKKVALTFDDGPKLFNSSHTLNALRKTGMKATFFVCGNQFEDYEQVMRRQFDGNHQIGNHSFSHKSGYALAPDALQRQVWRNDEGTLRLLGERSEIFRAPGGLWPPWQAAQIGLPIIMWSVDTYDFTGKNASGILYSVRKFAQDGDIILLHDTRDNTHKAVPLIADYLDSQGYLTLTVSELAWMEGVKLEPNQIYARFLGGRSDERRDSNLN